MSQITAFTTASEIGAVITLTGNSGGAVSPDGAGNINIVGSTGIVVVDNPGTHTLTISGSTEAGSFVTNSGTATPAGGILNIFDTQGTAKFTGAGNTVTHAYSDALSNIGIGLNVLVNNLGLGTFNTAFGNRALQTLVSGTDNNAFGYSSLAALIDGVSNCAIGEAGENVESGSYNVLIGNAAGNNYTTGESSNICVGYGTVGTASEDNVLRIGAGTGTSNGFLNSAYICGINGINVGSVSSVVSISGNQLGFTTMTAGTGILITPGAKTITISATGTTALNYTSVTASPYVVASNDDYLGVTTSSIAITIELPNAPATGRVYAVKDSTGTAATHNITVTTVGGSVNIDGATSFTMNANYQSIQVIFNGSGFEIF